MPISFASIFLFDVSGLRWCVLREAFPMALRRAWRFVCVSSRVSVGVVVRICTAIGGAGMECGEWNRSVCCGDGAKLR